MELLCVGPYFTFCPSFINVWQVGVKSRLNVMGNVGHSDVLVLI